MGHLTIYFPNNNNFGRIHKACACGIDLFNEKELHYSVHLDRIEFRELILSDKKNILKPQHQSTNRIFHLISSYIITGKYIIEDDNYKDGILTIWFEDVIK